MPHVVVVVPVAVVVKHELRVEQELGLHHVHGARPTQLSPLLNYQYINHEVSHEFFDSRVAGTLPDMIVASCRVNLEASSLLIAIEIFDAKFKLVFDTGVET